MFVIPKILALWKVHLCPFLPGQCRELLGSDKLLQQRNHGLIYTKAEKQGCWKSPKINTLFFFYLVSLSDETTTVNFRQTVFPVLSKNIKPFHFNRDSSKPSFSEYGIKPEP